MSPSFLTWIGRLITSLNIFSPASFHIKCLQRIDTWVLESHFSLRNGMECGTGTSGLKLAIWRKKMNVCERGSSANFVTLNFKPPPKKSTQLFFNELSNLPTLQCPSLYFESFPSTPTYTPRVCLCLFCPALKVSLLHLVNDFAIWTECVLSVCCKQ